MLQKDYQLRPKAAELLADPRLNQYIRAEEFSSVNLSFIDTDDLLSPICKPKDDNTSENRKISIYPDSTKSETLNSPSRYTFKDETSNLILLKDVLGSISNSPTGSRATTTVSVYKNRTEQKSRMKGILQWINDPSRPSY